MVIGPAQRGTIEKDFKKPARNPRSETPLTGSPVALEKRTERRRVASSQRGSPSRRNSPSGIDPARCRGRGVRGARRWLHHQQHSATGRAVGDLHLANPPAIRKGAIGHHVTRLGRPGARPAQIKDRSAVSMPDRVRPASLTTPLSRGRARKVRGRVKLRSEPRRRLRKVFQMS